MTRFYYEHAGKRSGPFSSVELKQLATEGRILPDDTVVTESLDKRCRARSVKGLFEPADAKPAAPFRGPTTRRDVPTHQEPVVPSLEASRSKSTGGHDPVRASRRNRWLVTGGIGAAGCVVIAIVVVFAMPPGQNKNDGMNNFATSTSAPRSPKDKTSEPKKPLKSVGKVEGEDRREAETKAEEKPEPEREADGEAKPEGIPEENDKPEPQSKAKPEGKADLEPQEDSGLSDPKDRALSSLKHAKSITLRMLPGLHKFDGVASAEAHFAKKVGKFVEKPLRLASLLTLAEEIGSIEKQMALYVTVSAPQELKAIQSLLGREESFKKAGDDDEEKVDWYKYGELEFGASQGSVKCLLIRCPPDLKTQKSKDERAESKSLVKDSKNEPWQSDWKAFIKAIHSRESDPYFIGKDVEWNGLIKEIVPNAAKLVLTRL